MTVYPSVSVYRKSGSFTSHFENALVTKDIIRHMADRDSLFILLLDDSGEQVGDMLVTLAMLEGMVAQAKDALWRE
jgi:hypothetical protein